jgi:dolichyl-phosphate-mannose-protein mannosyltransferase
LQPIDAPIAPDTRSRPSPPTRRRPIGSPRPSSLEPPRRARAPLPAPPSPPQATPLAGQRGARAWLRRHLPGLILGGVLLAAAAVALASGLNRFPPLTDDEGTYVAQAWAVSERGMLAHYTYWYDHPPLGWVQLAGLRLLIAPFLAVIGHAPTAVLDARRAMLIPALASVALVYVLARRLGMGRGFAALALALFAFNPLALSLLRGVLLDGLALPWMLAAFALALSPQRRLWAFAGAGACAAISVLSKETMFIVIPAIGLAVWQQCDRRTRSFCLAAFALPLVLLMLGYPLLALLKGELIPGHGHVSLFEAVRFQLFDRPSTGSVLDASSGSRRIVDTWLHDDTLLLVGGLVVLPFAFARRHLRPIAVAIGLLVLMALRPGYLPVGYVLAILPLAAIALAGVLERVWRRARPHLTRPVARSLAVSAGVMLSVAALIAVGARWDNTRQARNAYDNNANYVSALRWVTKHVDPDSRALVDDTFFVDLAEAGFEPGLGVVWFYKLDTSTNLDPTVRRALPNGAGEFDIVISTPIMRSALRENRGQLQEVRKALRRSVVVATFGRRDGRDRVEVRRLERTPSEAPNA